MAIFHLYKHHVMEHSCVNYMYYTQFECKTSLAPPFLDICYIHIVHYSICLCYISHEPCKYVGRLFIIICSQWGDLLRLWPTIKVEAHEVYNNEGNNPNDMIVWLSMLLLRFGFAVCVCPSFILSILMP